ncbi:protein arginine N-methyltransferase 1 [Amyelois transitella]|uniref:protein arginine N-methyltransferase 1 n=1 Tax=Amyelois transitella TaxID=680683 RepID=UPI00067C266E|nr:protein arginine N-methyltransferase 1 [Amyelois transitella]
MSDELDLSSDEETFEEDDWQEMETSNTMVKCLFCCDLFPSVEEGIKHCETGHNFNLNTLKSKFNMDCYSYIKLINYIKTHNPNPEDIMNTPKPLWDSERYMKPVDDEVDDWLMFDFDTVVCNPSSPLTYHANVENGLVTLTQAHFSELQRTIRNLSEQLNESNIYLEMAKDDINKMQESMKGLADVGQTSTNANGNNNGNGNAYTINCVSKVPLEDDEGYFNTYAHFGIHYDMLSDKVRTESYRDAILNNKETFNDKVVLDLGCGTGILSMFCATAGAKKVYALDQSEVIYHAMDIIRENNLQHVIKTIKGRLENTKLEEKVDIIVSEWMGYFLLFEGMLDSVIYARDNHLKPGGLLLPNKCNISLVANGDTDTHKKLIDYWSDVYGYKMNCMKSEVVREASVDIVGSKHIISEPCIVKEIDINTCNTDVMDFTSYFELPITRDGTLTSLVGYFDTFFDLPNRVSFSTGPETTPTHWKQTVFYFKDCKDVKQGDVIKGVIICNRQKTDVRALAVQINVLGKNHKYILS